MEGVLVSAKREGSTITTTVVTNEQGRYSFPADAHGSRANTRSRSARSATSSTAPKTVDVAAGSAATADLKLSKAKNLCRSSPTANG